VALIGTASLGNGEVRALAVSDDGRFVAAAGDDGLLFWDSTATGGLTGALSVKHIIRRHSVYAVALSPDGSTLASADATGVWLWNPQTGKKLVDKPLLTEAGVRELCFTPSEGRRWTSRILAVAFERNVKLYDLPSGALGEMPRLHEGRIQCLAFGAHGKQLATASEDGDIRVWELSIADKMIQVVPKQRLKGHTEIVTDLAFSHDGKSLVSGGQDRAVIVWDPQSGQERVQFAGHTDRVIRLGFMPRDTGLVSVGRDGTVKRWRADPPLFPRVGSVSDGVPETRR